MRFVLKDTNIFPMDSNPHMLHIATVGYGLRDFVCMLCIMGSKANNLYIEELVPTTNSSVEDIYGNFKFIDDDDLATELAMFLAMHNITSIDKIASILAETKRIGWLTGAHLPKDYVFKLQS